ncbi:MAG TPA: hypothetical protein VG425_07005 [Casimicrobiaceae bacterium]|jgi:hypothetical protein|nr:hypothetical protein [Casimicrobiaceae bacterium]
MPAQQRVEVRDGIGRFLLSGEFSLVEAVELISKAIAYCRDQKTDKLLIDAAGVVGVSIPSLVDRFLIAEEWAQEAEGMVVVVLVVRAEYIHPEKFAVRVAADFGLTLDVYTSEAEAMKWLSSRVDGPDRKSDPAPV